MSVISSHQSSGSDQLPNPVHTRLYELYDQRVHVLTCSKVTLSHMLHMIEAIALQQSGDSLLVAGIYDHNHWSIHSAHVLSSSHTPPVLPSVCFEKQPLESMHEGFFLALCPETCFILCGYPHKTHVHDAALWFDVRFSFLPEDINRALDHLHASSAFGQALSATLQKKRKVQKPSHRQNELVTSFLHEVATVEAQQHRQAASMNNELQAQLNWRDDFTTMLVHDLRTPLNGIMLLLQMLSADSLVNSIKNYGVLLDLEIQSAINLDALIQTLLDLNRLESNMFSLQMQPVNIHQLVRDTIDSCMVVLEHARITLRTEFTDPPFPAWADPMLLQRVIRNIMDNAVRFSFPNSTITIRIAYSAYQKCVLVHIIDTGRGIPEATLPHIFERHYQAQRRDQRGAGVGLYFCLLAMRAQQGGIAVNSKPNRGTTFTLSLPTEPMSNNVSQ